MNAFRLKNQINEFLQEAKQRIQTFIEFVEDENEELWLMFETLNEKAMLHMAVECKKEMSPEKFEQFISDLEQQYRIYISQARKLDKYSKFNLIVEVKQAWKRYKEIHRTFDYLQRLLKNSLTKMKVIVTKIDNLDNNTIIKYYSYLKDSLDEIDKVYDRIMKLLTYRLFEIDFVPYIDLMFAGNTTITKNEMLSIITPDHCFESKQEYIRSLPDEIDRDTFHCAIFVEKIEDIDNDVFAEMMFDSIMQKRERDEEVRKQMDEMIDEIFGDKLPTYQVTYDEYLQPIEIKRNPPKLKVIEGGIQ
ncbi:retrotransposon gag family protein [Thermaerobacillus caldiproteolyticus]|uniref:Uncharacterized protein n=1 Tax=Thermaerobacillus caldiproteolyticus TaxID=247480 RepID=A0A7W0C0J6_9BACL|nr:hypothetical protein [Anoxybacillus caldiproteolyticus]MBA2876880.1 hypothetical protein [Anoxybacillus caldiproteolyticus]